MKDLSRTVRISLVAMALIVVAICLQSLMSISTDPAQSTFSYSIGLMDHVEDVSFAGEQMPTQGEYYFTREMFDREVAVTLLNAPQLIMIHKRQSYYFPYIEKKLREAGIPDDFKYLAVAESSLRNTAVSTA